MEQEAAIRLAIQRLSRLIRWRRAAYYGLRGLAWGLGVALLPVALRAALGSYALPMAVAVPIGGTLGGALYGLAMRIPAGDAARVADRAFALHDRLGTALELLGGPEGGWLATAAIRDAADHVRRLNVGRAVPWRWPREGRLVPVAAVALAVLPYLPPIPALDVHLPSLPPTAEDEKKAERPGAPQVTERPISSKVERAERVEVPEREYAQRQNPDREQAKGDLAAAFKDTKVASKRPDFSSFLKQGDDRIRLLERVDSLPDLQRDFTQSPYKIMFRKSRSLLGGMDPRQMSPERLRQLLDEMNRLGRRGGRSGGEGGEWGQELMEGAEALNQGQMSRALDAMERALGKMRDMEERERGGKGLSGGRDRDGKNRDGRGGGRPGEDEPDFGEGQGSLPGKGKNPAWRGDPTGRLGQMPLDLGVEGQMRKGRKEGYDTNMIGRGAQNPSRLPYMSVYSQYRKMMEDALAKESIPLDYRSQVKDYFQSLEER